MESIRWQRAVVKCREAVDQPGASDLIGRECILLWVDERDWQERMIAPDLKEGATSWEATPRTPRPTISEWSSILAPREATSERAVVEAAIAYGSDPDGPKWADLHTVLIEAVQQLIEARRTIA